ncbi:hypothetical protein EV192_11532 [Actinocrispum wychmicini]|uniref:Uncharacterized protein n=1 Tax=Actinocrispum wychmicini TaxID=1213861 RepID=A0A4R2ITI8_9PSEU|nr:hypothetical protein EV192_11532 [Actinocrispum wychmicini]
MEMVRGGAASDISHLTDMLSFTHVQLVTVMSMSMPWERWLPTGQNT